MKISLILFFVLPSFYSAQEPLASGAAPKPTVSRPKVDPDQIAVKECDSINEDSITVLEAVKIFERASGKQVIMTKDLADDTLSFDMKGPLVNSELARFIQLILLAEGVAMMPVPDESGVVRLIQSGPIASSGIRGNERFYHESDLPAEDELVMFWMPFKYLKPEEALKIFQAAMGSMSTSGTIAAVPSGSALIITEKVSLIRQMLRIREGIDVLIGDREKWVKVEHGDVEEIAKRMNEIYDGQASRIRTTHATTPPLSGSQLGDESGGDVVPLRIIGVTRTSRILLVGRPSDLVAAEAMIRSFDQQSGGSRRQIFRLRYQRVSDFLAIAEAAIASAWGEKGKSDGPDSKSSAKSKERRRGPQESNHCAFLDDHLLTAPESVLVGSSLLVADKAANTILVQGSPQEIAIVRDLILNLDSDFIELRSIASWWTEGKILQADSVDR